MKRILPVLLCIVSISATAQVKNVVFVGDHFTNANELANMLYELALTKGDTLTYEVSAPQQTTLDQHTTNLLTIDLLNDGGWDHMIIQDQGQQPIFAIEQVEAEVFEPASELVDYSREFSDCCMPIFFMTWGYQDGDEDNCDDIPEVCNFGGMTDLLSERYLQMAQDNDCWVAPIGEAFRYVRQSTGDTIPLYEQDGFSPSLAGSYLTACVLYASIWGESPQGSTYYGGIPDDDGFYLQSAANEIVLNQYDDWNFISYLDADLIFNPGTPFTSVEVETSSYTDSIVVNYEGETFVWQDGDVSSLLLESGTHYFEITIYSSCVQETAFFLDSLVIDGPVNLYDAMTHSYRFYPNPFSDNITIEGVSPKESVFVTDMMGRQVSVEFLRREDRIVISGSGLESGVYHVVIGDADQPKVIKIIRD